MKYPEQYELNLNSLKKTNNPVFSGFEYLEEVRKLKRINCFFICKFYL